jgi:type II secretory pathway component GspD/PulD (secretin)
MPSINACVTSFLMLFLFCSSALARAGSQQTADQVYATHVAADRDLEEIAGAVRKIALIPDARADIASKSVVLRGTPEQTALAHWLIIELDTPGGRSPSADYRTKDGSDDLVRVFRPAVATELVDINEIAVGFQLLADLKQIWCNIAQKAIIVRGSATQMEAAAWLLAELDKQPAARPSSSPAHPVSFPPGQAIRVFYPKNLQTPLELQELNFAMRTVAGIGRILLFDRWMALALRGTPDDVALAGWLISELDSEPITSGATRMYWAPNPRVGDVVEVFHLKNIATPRDHQEIADILGKKANIQCRVVCTRPNAVIARGTPANMALAEELIKSWDRPRPHADVH